MVLFLRELIRQPKSSVSVVMRFAIQGLVPPLEQCGDLKIEI